MVGRVVTQRGSIATFTCVNNIFERHSDLCRMGARVGAGAGAGMGVYELVKRKQSCLRSSCGTNPHDHVDGEEVLPRVRKTSNNHTQRKEQGKISEALYSKPHPLPPCHGLSAGIQDTSYDVMISTITNKKGHFS